MDPRELFETNLSLIDRVIGRVCAKAGLSGADADDFRADAHLALLENDCAILRQWEGRSALTTYLMVIVQRLYADTCVRAAGRWHPSAEAKRMGEAAVALEYAVRRQGRSIDEALPAARAIDPSLTRDRAREIVDRLPERAPRPRLVALDPEAEIPTARDAADTRAVATEAERLARRTSRIVRETIEGMPLEDRMIVRLRYGSGMSLADVARMLRLPQRPLYRRIESILDRLRSAVRHAGIESDAIEELIGSPISAMDFGLRKTDEARQTNHSAGEQVP